MTRKLSISALALTVALAGGFAVPAQSSWVTTGALTVAWQAQQVSRWQVDRFGPIVSSDTMWTIATYYGRQRGVSVYDMMDAIVAANPRVFIDNRPDRMMDGYYLVIPAIGKTAPQVEKTVEQPQQPVVTVAETSDDTVQFKADELRDLRDRLSGSIGMIEQLQTENETLQTRLNAVTAELESLKAQLEEDRAIDQEIDAIAGEIANQVPGVEGSQERVIETAETVEQPVADTTVVETEVAETEVVETEQAKPVVIEQRQTPVSTSTPPASKAGTPNFFDWLLQAPQLYVVIAVPVLLVLILLYMAYVRRIRREFEQQPEQTQAADADVTEAPDATVDTDTPAETSEPEQQQRDAIDATAVVTGLAAVTGAAVVVAKQSAEATEAEPNTDYSDAELAALFNDIEADAEVEAEAESDFETDLETGLETDHELADELAPDLRDETEVNDLTELADDSTEAFDLSQFEVAENDPLLTSVDDEIYLADTELDGYLDLGDADSDTTTAAGATSELDTDSTEISIDGLDDDDDFAKLLASLEAPSGEPSTLDQERQPPVAKREPKLHDDSLSGLSLADDNASDDGDYVSIDALLNDAEAADDEPFTSVEFDTPGVDESKTPAAMLDLAQAYIDMGELDDARNLLKKIVGCDDADADREAALLLQQLDNQSGR